MEEFAHVATMARAQGIDFEVIGPNEIKARYPLHRTRTTCRARLWDPLDGDIDPRS